MLIAGGIFLLTAAFATETLPRRRVCKTVEILDESIGEAADILIIAISCVGENIGL